MSAPRIYEYDVIVCGGGPGGSTAALTFYDSGLRVAVIEKTRFPREKVCGDGMNAYIPKALGAISPAFRQAFDNFENKLTVSKFLLSSYNGKVTKLEIPQKFFISQRYHFDNFLYEQTKKFPNINYFFECQIKDLSVEDDKCTLFTDKNEVFHSKIVIGCDGATSLVRKKLTDYKMNPVNHYAAIRAYYENVGECSQDCFEFYLSKKYPEGYFWVFPSFNDQVNIGFGLFSDKVAKSKIILKDAMMEIIEDTPTLKERFKNARLVDDIKGWSIPFGHGEYPISGKRFMLCGDAASLADPITGEGIGPAMVSGRIAAKQAINCFKENDFSGNFMKQYDKAIHEKYGRTYNKRRRLIGISTNNKWLVNSLIGIFSSLRINKLALKYFIKLVS